MSDGLRVHILDTGHSLASEGILMAGGGRRRIECHCLVALLEHPERGWVLWDTGYSPRMLEETRRLPYRLYRAATPLRLRPELAVSAQLPRLGLAPEDIRTVVLSHFHADHLCGLLDFGGARLVTTEAAWASVEGLSGWRALRRAFIPRLAPPDFRKRATLLPRFSGPELGPLGPTHDLFGDGSMVLVELPGHAAGQFGMLARTERGPMLLAADGAWLRQAVRERRPPHPATHFFLDDPAAARDTLDRLHAFHRERPEVILVPTHCPEAYAELVR